MGKLEAYEDAFWGGDLSSFEGYEALRKRHYDNKKLFQEFEDYLKKRSKLEQEYCKSLFGLAKCFKQKTPCGQIEVAVNQLKNELETMSLSHNGASQFFAKQAEDIKKFRDDQTSKNKQIDESLLKLQNSKTTQLSKTISLEKTYVKKHQERDLAQSNWKEAKDLGAAAVQKELDKAQSRAEKAEMEAQKSDDVYHSAVLTLDDCRVKWEKEMVKACKATEELDKDRIRKMRQELWVAVNVDSKTALDIDHCCENVRQKLELCDIQNDINSFLSIASTGTKHPDPFLYKPYTKNSVSSNDFSSDVNPYTDIANAGSDIPSNYHKSKLNTLTRAKGKGLFS